VHVHFKVAEDDIHTLQHVLRKVS